jgi:nucleotide-binding universal stress UspA family protein
MNSTTLKSILVPIDFSDISLNALDTALTIGETHGANIMLLHVIQIPSISMAGQYEVYPMEVINAENEKKAATTVLENLRHKHQQSYPYPIRLRVEEGIIAEKICSVGDEEDAELIVMGASGASEIKKLILGSNAFAVLRSAECPVLTIPLNTNWSAIQTILFPVRNVSGVVQKGEFLQKLIPERKKQIHLLGLSEDGEDSNGLNDLLNQINFWMKEAGNQTSQSRVSTSNPAKEVRNKADDMHADLIVINATLDHKIFSDYFFGPYPERILNHANLPVLSMRGVKSEQPFSSIKNIPVLEERIGHMAMYSKPYIEYN